MAVFKLCIIFICLLVLFLNFLFFASLCWPKKKKNWKYIVSQHQSSPWNVLFLLLFSARMRSNDIFNIDEKKNDFTKRNERKKSIRSNIDLSGRHFSKSSWDWMFFPFSVDISVFASDAFLFVFISLLYRFVYRRCACVGGGGGGGPKLIRCIG